MLWFTTNSQNFGGKIKPSKKEENLEELFDKKKKFTYY